MYGVDDLGDFNFARQSSGKISDFIKTIFDHDGTSLCKSAHSDKLNAEQENNKETPEKADQNIYKPNRYKIKFVDKILKFFPSTDTLEIDTDSFGINNSAIFTAGRNKKSIKKKLAKQHFDFLYDQKKGGLYFKGNGSGKGFGDGGIIAILKGAPELTADTLKFIRGF